MAVAKVTSRGQVTLPSRVRRQLNIARGDDLLIDVDPETKTAFLRVIKKMRLSEFYGAFSVAGRWAGKAKEIQAVGEYLSAHAERSLRKRSRR